MKLLSNQQQNADKNKAKNKRHQKKKQKGEPHSSVDQQPEENTGSYSN